MKYASVFATILFIWIAAIITALLVTKTNEVFELYLAAIIMTTVLFIIGFRKK